MTPAAAAMLAFTILVTGGALGLLWHFLRHMLKRQRRHATYVDRNPAPDTRDWQGDFERWRRG